MQTFLMPKSFLKEAAVADIRVFCGIGDKVVAAMKRQGAEVSFVRIASWRFSRFGQALAKKKEATAVCCKQHNGLKYVGGVNLLRFILRGPVVDGSELVTGLEA